MLYMLLKNIWSIDTDLDASITQSKYSPESLYTELNALREQEILTEHFCFITIETIEIVTPTKRHQGEDLP